MLGGAAKCSEERSQYIKMRWFLEGRTVTAFTFRILHTTHLHLYIKTLVPFAFFRRCGNPKNSSLSETKEGDCESVEQAKIEVFVIFDNILTVFQISNPDTNTHLDLFSDGFDLL